jgi:uncharacterized membrane-anchored protein
MSHRLALILTIAALACSSSPGLDAQLDAVRSWTATLHLAADQQRADAITAAYAAQLRGKATKALNAAHHGIPQAVRSPDDRARARMAVDSLEQAIHLLDRERRP